MGFRRRTRRRALVAGAMIAHHRDNKYADEQAQEEAPAEEEQAPDQTPEQAQYAPPPADPADQIEHLAQLHTSGVLTDDEFATAKAKVLSS